MRDSVYEVESPRMGSRAVQYRHTLNLDNVFNQFLNEFLLFEIATTSEEMMVASKHCWSILKNQKSCETKRPFFGCSAQFVREFLLFERAMNSEDIMAPSLNLSGG